MHIASGISTFYKHLCPVLRIKLAFNSSMFCLCRGRLPRKKFNSTIFSGLQFSYLLTWSKFVCEISNYSSNWIGLFSFFLNINIFPSHQNPSKLVGQKSIDPQFFDNNCWIFHEIFYWLLMIINDLKLFLILFCFK